MEIQELAKDLFEGTEVRILGTIDEPLFVANDIGSVLGLTQIRKTLSDFDDSEKVGKIVPTPGGNQAMTLLTEKGLYKLLFTSRKKEPPAFADGRYKFVSLTSR